MSQMPRSFFVQRPSFSSGGTWDCEPDSSLPSALRWPRSDASPSTIAASDRREVTRRGQPQRAVALSKRASSLFSVIGARRDG
jgi:hypothetical protein